MRTLVEFDYARLLIPAPRVLCQKKCEPRAWRLVWPGGLFRRRPDGTLLVSY